MTYNKTSLDNGAWIITEHGHNYLNPCSTFTFAFDTETLIMINGHVCSPNKIFKRLNGLTMEQKRQILSCRVWAWQVYDEFNGFFMTNSFNEMLSYISRAGYKFGWCYNATFDFSQIDYQILAVGKDKWHKHEGKEKGKGYNKSQPYTYESLHNSEGARYAYKLWIPYRNKDRHEYVHSVEFRDFMKLIPGGLAKLLIDLDIQDNDGVKIRKLEMDYQAVNIDNPSISDIAYCCNDVKGLYFAVKKFNVTIEEQSNGESHCYGKDTNVMTAGGFAKSELLRSLYPQIKKKSRRIETYKREHPITQQQDKWVRDNHLYRGGISYVNPKYKGRLLSHKQFGLTMQRYDVNSEYPYAMASMRDLIGRPIRISYRNWLKMQNKDEYECILILRGVVGIVKPNMLGMWYNPFEHDYVDKISENGMHLMFERELQELLNWYELEYECTEVIIIKRGDYAYAPFVETNYALKAQAKADGNKTLQTVTKLKLNSSYGKLSERIEKKEGEYKLNELNGAIHFVETGMVTDDSSALNVIIGALVTCIARCYILSKIREVCGNRVSELFVYIDTDSIHAFAEYANADAFILGGLKEEARCTYAKYIAPKTYFDVENDNNGILELQNIEIHTKGVNVASVKQVLKKPPKLSIQYLDKKFTYGQKFKVLQAMNVRGGKVLIPVEKYLARWELAPDDYFINTYEGMYINER